MTSPEASRLPAYVVWLVYSAAWGFVGTLSWTTAAVYFIRDADMSALELILAGTALEVAYFLFEVPTGVVADLYSRRLSIVIACPGLWGWRLALTGAIASVPVILAGDGPGGASAGRSAAVPNTPGWPTRSGLKAPLGDAYQRGPRSSGSAGLVGSLPLRDSRSLDLGLPFPSSPAAYGRRPRGFWPSQCRRPGFVRPTRAEHTPRSRQRGHAGTCPVPRVVRIHHVLILIVGIAFVEGAWSEGFDRLKELHLLDNVGLPDIGDLDNLVWFGILQAGGLLLSILVAAPLLSRLENLDLARPARPLFALYALLIVVALLFALAYSLWPAIAAFWSTMVVRQFISAPYRTLARRLDHRLLGASDSPRRS